MKLRSAWRIMGPDGIYHIITNDASSLPYWKWAAKDSPNTHCCVRVFILR